MRRALLTLFTVALAACGGGVSGSGSPTTAAPTPTTTTVAPPQRLLQADLVGGCFMMGPNCARYVLFDDGSLEVYRLGTEPPELLWTDSIEVSLVADLQEALAATDLEELRSQLGSGTCNACVDGIDTVLTFTVDGSDTVFDSAQVELDTTEPLFITAALAVQAATATGQVPIVAR